MTSRTTRQKANAVLMIRPYHFYSNPQTAASNRFQGQTILSKKDQQSYAVAEFDNFVSILESAGITVIQFDDTALPETPDSIFPNNWVSFHHDGLVVLYPMEAKNRRTERRIDIIDALSSRYNFEVREILDLSNYETRDMFLEGTGSMVMDHKNRIIYACRSSRTNLKVLSDLVNRINYVSVTFNAIDRYGDPIYHTNVMMNIGEELAIVCLDSVSLIDEKNSLLESLKANNSEVLLLSVAQMEAFAGNMLELESSNGESVLIMSEQARESLDEKQIICIEKHVKIISAPLNNIEASAGGSARCMLAEIYLPKKENIK